MATKAVKRTKRGSKRGSTQMIDMRGPGRSFDVGGSRPGESRPTSTPRSTAPGIPLPKKSRKANHGAAVSAVARSGAGGAAVRTVARSNAGRPPNAGAPGIGTAPGGGLPARPNPPRGFRTPPASPPGTPKKPRGGYKNKTNRAG